MHGQQNIKISQIIW